MRYSGSGRRRRTDPAGRAFDRVETISGLTAARGRAGAANPIVDVDVGDPPSVYDLEVTPSDLSLRLGSRERVRDTIESIRSTVETTSERV